MRAFIAVEIPDELKDVITGYIEELSARDSGVRWVRPDQLHLTLKFLGSINEEQREFVEDVLGRVSTEERPFEIKIEGVGAFPDFRRPSVLWAGVTGGQRELARLARRIDKLLRPLGLKQEKRAFRAHLTLGRVKKPGAIEEVRSKMRHDLTRSFGRCTAFEIVLFSSTLMPEGAVYEALSRYPFRSDAE